METKQKTGSSIPLGQSSSEKSSISSSTLHIRSSNSTFGSFAGGLAVITRRSLFKARGGSETLTGDTKSSSSSSSIGRKLGAVDRRLAGCGTGSDGGVILGWESRSKSIPSEKDGGSKPKSAIIEKIGGGGSFLCYFQYKRWILRDERKFWWIFKRGVLAPWNFRGAPF